MTTGDDTSLYQTLGGEPAVAAAIEAFYTRVLADPALAPFFKDTRMDRLKEHQRRFFAQALGGPQHYTGRPLPVAHAGLGITDAHFDLVAGHLVDTLTGLGVPQETVTNVVGLIAPLRSDVVGA